MERDSQITIKLRQYLYYCLIAISSFVALVFLPMLGTDVDAGWNFPKDSQGWTVFIVIRLIVSFLNVFIFASFVNQGKLNVSGDPNYKKAQELLAKVKNKEYIPRSPRKFNATEYGRKGVTVFFSTAASLVSLTQAILSYDWVALLTYALTVTGSIVFGIFEMKKVEIYWTVEYLEYAERQVALEEENNGREIRISEPSTASGEEQEGHSGSMGDEIRA